MVKDAPSAKELVQMVPLNFVVPPSKFAQLIIWEQQNAQLLILTQEDVVIGRKMRMEIVVKPQLKTIKSLRVLMDM